MPLFIYIPNARPIQESEGLASILKAPSISAPKPPDKGEFCLCAYECAPSELALYDADKSDLRNDRAQFLYARKSSSDTIAVKVLKAGVEVAAMSSDLGTVWDGFANQPLYWGCEIEWLKVAETYGPGLYAIESSLSIVGFEYKYTSRVFEVAPYSEHRAHKTVKIVSYQQGNIAALDVDHTDLISTGWKQSYRIRGTFGSKLPTLEQNNYLDSKYTIRQIQDKIIREYTLKADYLSAEVADDLFYTNMLANKLVITDYSLLNADKYKSFDVVPIEVSDVVYMGTKVRHTWRFKDRKENFLKTNY